MIRPLSALHKSALAVGRWTQTGPESETFAPGPQWAIALQRPELRPLLVGLSIFFILFARRNSQMLDPQVWQEEFIIVFQMIAHGPASIFMPLSGYLVIVPRLISFVALLVPFYEYPRVATVLTWAVTVVMLAAVSLVPSRLRGGPLLAISALFIPTDAEVFGLPLYTFWWTIPLLYAAYFWQSDRQIMWWRIAAIVISGLSAPAILSVAPLFVVSAFLQRTKDSIAAAIAAVICALLQSTSVAQMKSLGSPETFATAEIAIRKLFGGFLVWNLLAADAFRDMFALICGIATLGLLVFAIVRERDLRGVLLPLTYLWLSSVALTVARVNVAILDQDVAGPRYYFLPFVLEGWFLLQVVLGARTVPLRWIGGLMLLTAAFNALPVLSRTHADLAWKSSVQACAAAPAAAVFNLPVQENGLASPHWLLPILGRDCRRLDRFGLVGLLFPS